MQQFIWRRLILKPFIVAAIAMTTALPATADDLDVFTAKLATLNKPNILFVLDYSGSMISNIDGSSKIDILRSAVNGVLETNKGKVNVGIGSLYQQMASGVRWPVSDIEADANTIDPQIPAGSIDVAGVISAQLDRLNANQATATVNALAEAAAYFRGDPVLLGDRSLGDPWNYQADVWDDVTKQYVNGNPQVALPITYAPQDSYSAEADPSLGSWERPSYVSPLASACQANYIVLISDGVPTIRNDTTAVNTVLNAAGVNGISNCDDLTNTIFADDVYTTDEGNCASEIVHYLANNDINPNIAGTNVKTFAIGFDIDDAGKNYLDLIAESGGTTESNQANDPAQLVTALNNVFDEALKGSENFAELAVDVNPTTFSHDDKAYFSLFSPSSKSSWNGNLKGYFLDDRGLVDVNNELATYDDGAGLKFKDTAQSFWSSTADGNEVDDGGASETITDLTPLVNNRKIYTYLGGANKTLSQPDESMLIATNNNITKELMGISSEQLREASLSWLANAPMGSPLHTKPVSVNYDNGNGPMNVVYIMTNQGLLHAFDATKPSEPSSTNPDLTGGAELFAFMPQELLPNIPKLYAPTADDDHVYGLDGPVTRWHIDGNKDGIVNDNDSVQLVFGMRRGGTNYYSIDVTDPQNPEYKWRIGNDVTDFENLAQTWSRPSLISVNRNGIKEQVLIFGGGYDADLVDNTTEPKEASGNAVYIVDALGEHIQTFTHNDMDYSIPSDITVLDTDRNGMADRAYFGDLGGQMWRVDFDDVESSGTTTVRTFADVKDFNEYRPIFYPPSVSMNSEQGKRFFAIAFGTGDRTQPMLENSENAFYMLRDENYEVGAATNDYGTITTTSIYDATENNVGSSVQQISDQAKSDLRNASGWLVRLDNGEKALSKVVSFEGKFLATTFEPTVTLNDQGEVDPCEFSTIGRLYVLDLLDARPVQLLSDGTETQADLTKENRVVKLHGTAIPSSPVIIYPANSSKAQIFVDKESIVSVNKTITTVFWHAK